MSFSQSGQGIAVIVMLDQKGHATLGVRPPAGLINL
jgi:hypothetical protein